MIKAIQTYYKGYHFRSRLEARWAVFFDKAGVKYEYEPEGFDLGAEGWYLPDFWLPELKMWAEIKPDEVDDAAHRKIWALVLMTQQKATILSGDPYESVNASPSWDSPYEWALTVPLAPDHPAGKPVGEDYGYNFCVCPICDSVGFEYMGRGGRVCQFSGFPAQLGFEHRSPVKRTWEESDLLGHWDCNRYDGEKSYSHDHPILKAAAQAARSARFEHGASG